jgi:hypothetical protein
MLTVEIRHEHIRLNLWPEIFDTFRAPVDEFEKEGAHVKIFLSYRIDGDEPNVDYDLKHTI